MNDLYRLVTEQDGTIHVSSILLTRLEAIDSMVLEMLLHAATGWTCAVNLRDEDTESFIDCERDGIKRTLSLLKTNPMEAVHAAL